MTGNIEDCWQSLNDDVTKSGEEDWFNCFEHFKCYGMQERVMRNIKMKSVEEFDET